MKVRNVLAATAMALALVACKEKDQTGLPETETTGTAQSLQQTGSASATTTGSAAGTITNLPTEEKAFLVQAGLSGLAEVQQGNLALQKAQSADVKQYAQRMVTEHTASNEELSQLATAKGVALATELDAEHKSALEHLSALSGAEFDKAYMQHMIGDHQKAIAAFDRAATTATDADIKVWAQKTLPTLQQHLEQAKQISANLR